MQQDKERAIPYLREAAAMGINATIHLAELLLRDYGSPLDYEDTYRWLYNSVTADQRMYKRISRLRQGLELRILHRTSLQGLKCAMSFEQYRFPPFTVRVEPNKR